MIRPALMQFQAERVSGRPASRGSRSGPAPALVSAVVVALKVTLAD